MKRSELNSIIKNAIDYVAEKGVILPPFAHWGLNEWGNLKPSQKEIVENMLGWDITDFGTGDFKKYGLLIFTFRNGNLKDREKYPKPYAEKLLLVDDGQELPFHFHWSKMEDIINRGGGNVVIEMYESDLNDDTIDNRFHTAKGRFPNIEEDVEPEYLIFRDYEKYVKFS